MMFLALFWTGWAQAGLIDEMDDASRHLAYCKQAADDAESDKDWNRALGAWKVCLSEAERRQFATIVPSLKAQVAVSAALADSSALRESRPHEFAMRVLATVADYPAVDLPSDAARLVFRQWMETDEGRAYVGEVRTLTVIWEGLTSTTRADEAAQRALEDCGLKWATPGATGVNVIVYAKLAEKRLSLTETLESGELSKAGRYAQNRTTIAVDRVRFRTLDRTARGFTVVATAEAAEEIAASDAALRDAATLVARSALQRVLAELFPPEG